MFWILYILGEWKAMGKTYDNIEKKDALQVARSRCLYSSFFLVFFLWWCRQLENSHAHTPMHDAIKFCVILCKDAARLLCRRRLRRRCLCRRCADVPKYAYWEKSL